VQSVRFLDKLERKGRGWNLSLQVLDGILCHDGEMHSQGLSPLPITSFVEFDEKLRRKEQDPGHGLLPATLEGCVVRLADTIAYIGRDIEDAIVLGLVTREDIPKQAREILGNTNGTIVYSLVTDLISNSTLSHEAADSRIGFSKEISESLQELKRFNYEKIYLDPHTKRKYPLVRECYQQLFEYYLRCFSKGCTDLPKEIDLMTDIHSALLQDYSPAEKVRDFIAGMTDDYFLKQAQAIGCTIPEKD